MHPHLAEVLPEQKPSARRGLALNVLIPLRYQTEDYYKANSPEQIWKELRAEASFSELSDQQVWDLVAVVWTQQVAPEKLKLYEPVYADNCAACHGAAGKGMACLHPGPLKLLVRPSPPSIPLLARTPLMKPPLLRWTWDILWRLCLISKTRPKC
jgi:hypothetical protein